MWCFPATTGWEYPIQSGPVPPASRLISPARLPGATARVVVFALRRFAGAEDDAWERIGATSARAATMIPSVRDLHGDGSVAGGKPDDGLGVAELDPAGVVVEGL